MTGAQRIAVFQDSPEFGGHERAFLTWLPALLASPEIQSLDFFVPEVNAKLRSALADTAHPKLTVTPGPFVKGRAEPYKAPLRIGYGRAARAFAVGQRADLALLLQGRIENVATPMLWLPRGLELVSYLPMAHAGAEMGRSSAASRITDAAKRPYYARPQRVITPSRAVAAQARRAGARCPIYAVENVPAPQATPRPSRADARLSLGLKPDARIALFMGRFDAHQKGLDRLIRDLRHGAPRLAGWRFLFVGQGPAEGELRSVLDGGVKGEIIAWTATPELYLAASDVLLLPSRFEGVPLIMLEALQAGVPILASDIDVYREYLPAFCLRDFAQPVDLAEALDQITAPSLAKDFAAHAAAVSSRLDLHTSQQRFLGALLGTDITPDFAAVSAAGAPA